MSNFMLWHVIHVCHNNCGTPMLHSIQTQYSHSTCSYMTCDCNLAHGMPSSGHFTLEHYIQLKVFSLGMNWTLL